MSLSAIRTQIKTTLEGVSGIGTVHEYERWANDWKGFLELFKTSANVINGWMITRRKTPERWRTAEEYERVFEFAILGVYGLKDDDATEKTFQDLIEAICAAFRQDPDLGGACETTHPEFGSLAGRSGVQVEVVENRVLGSVLCHFCVLRIGAQVFESFS